MMAASFGLSIPLILAVTTFNFNFQNGNANDFFYRSPKWELLGPSGGSLVSGRGNFRPGFSSRIADNRLYISEPLFAYKRSRTNPGISDRINSNSNTGSSSNSRFNDIQSLPFIMH